MSNEMKFEDWCNKFDKEDINAAIAKVRQKAKSGKLSDAEHDAVFYLCADMRLLLNELYEVAGV
jgi:hypothetical protein